MFHHCVQLTYTSRVDRLIRGWAVRQNADTDFFGPTTGSVGWNGEWLGEQEQDHQADGGKRKVVDPRMGFFGSKNEMPIAT